ncbi:MAG TPA: GNAT family N-acetyltransferase [Polyangia bacterium]|nr:GNAT family N-acetyltransferase [Polyangia bacterium]
MRLRYLLSLDDGGDHLRAHEPMPAEVATAAPRLASFYNEPHNQAMLSHEDALTVADVAAHYRGLARAHARAFLLELDGLLVGDADLRHVEADRAEVAILIGERSIQGKGLGTRFGVMLHAFAFRTLGLRRLYATIIPANAASLRLFEKLGYERDDAPAARRYVDAPDDVALSLTPERFERLHGPLAARVTATPRAPRR